MRRAIGIAAIAMGLFSVATGSAYARQQGAAAPAEGRGALQPPPPPELLFNMTMQNETRLPLTQKSITTPNVDLHLYGDGKNIIVAVGNRANSPRTFFGLCEKPCGFKNLSFPAGLYRSGGRCSPVRSRLVLNG